MGLVEQIKDGDWRSVRSTIAKLASLKLGPKSAPTFANVTITEQVLASIIHIKDSEGNTIIYGDDDEFYFTASAVIPIAAGHGMPWLFWFTYAAP